MRGLRRHSNYSGLSSERQSLTWSLLPELRLSDISNIPVISLLLLPDEIWSNHHYSSSYEMPQNADRNALVTPSDVAEPESRIETVARVIPTSDKSSLAAAGSRSVQEGQMVTVIRRRATIMTFLTLPLRGRMRDSCFEVLPTILKKFNIDASPTQLSLWICLGDQQHCFDISEQPLLLFKQLKRFGQKPFLILRHELEVSHSPAQPPKAPRTSVSLASGGLASPP